MKRINIFFVLAALWAGMLIAEPNWQSSGPAGFAAKGSLSQESGNIPDVFIVTLELTYPAGFKPNADTMRSNLLSYDGLYPPFHLVEEENEGRVWKYTLEPLTAGKQPVTFLNIPFEGKSKDDKFVNVISGILFYDAHMPKEETDFTRYAAPLLPINNPAPTQIDGALRRQFNESTPDSIAQQNADIHARTIPWRGIVGLIIALGLYLAFRMNKKPVREVSNAPLKSHLALRQAEALLQELRAVPASHTAKSYFIALTDAVRFHLEENYGVDALTQTSEEFLADIRDSDILDESMSSELTAFLQICDAVKFGKYNPSEEEATQALAIAQEMMVSHPQR